MPSVWSSFNSLASRLDEILAIVADKSHNDYVRELPVTALSMLVRTQRLAKLATRYIHLRSSQGLFQTRPQLQIRSTLAMQSPALTLMHVPTLGTLCLIPFGFLL